jgi:hypothetical protein
MNSQITVPDIPLTHIKYTDECSMNAYFGQLSRREGKSRKLMSENCSRVSCSAESQWAVNMANHWYCLSFFESDQFLTPKKRITWLDRNAPRFFVQNIKIQQSCRAPRGCDGIRQLLNVSQYQQAISLFVTGMRSPVVSFAAIDIISRYNSFLVVLFNCFLSQTRDCCGHFKKHEEEMICNLTLCQIWLRSEKRAIV